MHEKIVVIGLDRKPRGRGNRLKGVLGEDCAASVDQVLGPSPTQESPDATAATAMLTAISELPNVSADECTPVSDRCKMLFAWGYRMFAFRYDERLATVVALRETESTVVEINSIQAFLPRQGYGTKTIETIRAQADRFGVTLWLCAHPYGRLVPQMPAPLLRKWYRRLGFYSVRRIPERWKNDYQRYVQHEDFSRCMIRNPQPSDGQWN